ncbi:MAG: GNAT family N-acetyltransferase [Rubrivivax sp.]|nr:GNAT family N-acetyltransferase [Rubrivivax sp.]
MRDSITALAARAMRAQAPGRDAEIRLGLAHDGDASVQAALDRTGAWVDERRRSAPEGTRIVLAGLDGLDPLACFEDDHRGSQQADTGLVLLAEVALQCDAHSPVGLPYRPHLLAVAQRNGWQLAGCEDLTAAVARFLALVLVLIQRQAGLLRAEGRDLGAAIRHLEQRLAALGSGSMAGQALQFERTERPAQRLVRVGAERSEAMRSLFKQVFGHEMSAAQWQWKYGDGRACAVGIEQDGRLTAHYGGQRRDLLVFGKPDVGCQMCDVMVEASANRSLARRGPMYRLTATLLETQLGWGQRHRIGFGFPSDRHNVLAKRLGLYTTVDSLVQVSWPAATAPAPVHHRSQTVTLVGGAIADSQRRAIDRLWRSMASAMTDVVLGVRDAAWLQWRYLQCPHASYTVTLVRSRWWRRPLGLYVTRVQDDALELLDLVAPPANFATLVELARAQAATVSRPLLRARITRSQSARLTSIDPQQVRVEELPIHIPANIHTPGPDPREIENRWFLMGGDADFT